MDELMNLMIADESPSEISDSIKTQLMQKATARIDALKPAVTNAMMGYELESEEDVEPDAETVGELDNDEEIVEQNELMAAEKELGIIPPTEQEMQIADSIIQSAGQKSEIEPEVDTDSVEAPESPEVPKGGEI